MTRRARAWSAIDRHPVRVVGAVGLVVAALHLGTVATSRPLGAFNTDEAGYLVDALQYQRALTDGLLGDGAPSLAPLAERIRSTSTGPLVPLLSAPFLLVGSRSPAWAMVVPALAHVIAAVAVAAIVAQLAGARRAVVAGVAVLGLPGAILAAQSYVYAMPAAALLALAALALARSERGHRTSAMVALGASVGALLLVRTMTVAFLPALAVAVALVVDCGRRSLRNAAVAAGVAAVVALPWWLAAWDQVTSYLADYGYGDLAEPYGESGIADRVQQRFGVAFVDVRPALLVLAAVIVVVAGRAWMGSGRARRARPPTPLVALAALVALGYLALLTSSNSGIWFELPLEVLAVAVVAVVASAAPASWQRRMGVAVVAVAVLNVALVGRAPLGERVVLVDDEQPVALSSFLFGGLYQPPPSIRTPDPRYFSDPDSRSSRAGAWWDAHGAIAAAVERGRGSGGLVHLEVIGSGPLLNLNSLELWFELEGDPPTGIERPASAGPQLGDDLRPSAGRSPRVLVILDARAEPFPSDVDAEAVEAEAIERAWRVVATIALPDGGEARVLLPAAR